MGNLLNIFNTRELATILWVSIFLVWALNKKDLRRSFYVFLIASMKLWRVLLIMTAYILGSIFVLYKLSFWELSLLKITIYWFFGWAFLMFINSAKIGKEAKYLRKSILQIVGLTVFVSFITSFYSFHFLIELVLVLFITIVAVLAAFTSIKKEYSQINSIMNGTLIIFGFTILIINLVRAVSNFKEFTTFSTLQEFLLPILLSFMFLPFLWVVSLYMKYEVRKVCGTVLGANKKRYHNAKI